MQPKDSRLIHSCMVRFWTSLPFRLQNSQGVGAQRNTRDHRLTLQSVKPRFRRKKELVQAYMVSCFLPKRKKELELVGQQPGTCCGPQPWHRSAEWLLICCLWMHHPDRIAAAQQAHVQPRECSRMDPNQAEEGIKGCCFCCSRPRSPCRERVAVIEAMAAIY